MTVECCSEVPVTAIRPKRTVLVMGTTAAGLMAASELLSKNLEVVLIDRTVSWRIANPDDQTFAALCNQIRSNPNAKVLFGTDLAALDGGPGGYGVILSTPLGRREMVVGGILLCLGDDSRWHTDLQAKINHYMASGAPPQPPTGGCHRDIGIWFAASSRIGRGLKPASNSVQQAVSALSELLDNLSMAHSQTADCAQ